MNSEENKACPMCGNGIRSGDDAAVQSPTCSCDSCDTQPSLELESDDVEWLDPKHTVKKRVLNQGVGLFCPRDCSFCRIEVSEISGVPKYVDEVFSEVLTGEVVVGNLDSCVGRMVEKILTTMRAEETAHYLCKLNVTEIREDIEHEVVPENLQVEALYCTFKLHLVSFEEKPDLYAVKDEEKFEKALAHKEKGIALYKHGYVRTAFYRFSKAAKWLILMDSSNQAADTKSRRLEALRRCYLNIAACQLDTGHNELVIKNCNRALEIDAGSQKAYYRRGLAYLSVQEYEKAMIDFKYILSIAPNNISAKKLLDKTKEKLHQWDEYYKQQMKKMFNPNKN